MYLSYFIEYHRFQNNYGSLVMVLSDLQAEYGTELDHDERIDAEKYFDIYASYLDEFIVGNPEYSEIGIFSGIELIEHTEKLNNPEGSHEWGAGDDPRWIAAKEEYRAFYNEYARRFSFGEYREASNHATWRFSALEYIFTQYDWCIEDGQGTMNLFPYRFAADTSRFSASLIIIVIIAVGVLLLPTITRDRQSNMTSLQYSSKAGRRILRTQFAAMMTSAFIISAIIICGFVVLFLHGNAEHFGIFYNQRIINFMFVPLIDITYSQYFMLLCGLTLLTIMGAAALFWFMSVYSRDYVQLLLKAIPLTAVLCIVGNSILQHLLIGNSLYYITHIIGIEFIVCGVVLAVGIGLCVFACKRAMGRDLL
jgi:hypothetical protein